MHRLSYDEHILDSPEANNCLINSKMATIRHYYDHLNPPQSWTLNDETWVENQIHLSDPLTDDGPGPGEVSRQRKTGTLYWMPFA